MRLLAGLLLAGAGAAQAAPPSYTTDIAPILKMRCATCHLTGKEAGDIQLVPAKAVANLVNVPSSESPALKRVVPGKPEASYMLMKLEGTHIAKGGKGARMPFGAPPLPPPQIALIRAWIAAGAKGN